MSKRIPRGVNSALSDVVTCYRCVPYEGQELYVAFTGGRIWHKATYRDKRFHLACGRSMAYNWKRRPAWRITRWPRRRCPKCVAAEGNR